MTTMGIIITIVLVMTSVYYIFKNEEEYENACAMQNSTEVTRILKRMEINSVTFWLSYVALTILVLTKITLLIISVF